MRYNMTKTFTLTSKSGQLPFQQKPRILQGAAQPSPYQLIAILGFSRLFLILFDHRILINLHFQADYMIGVYILSVRIRKAKSIMRRPQLLFCQNSS